MAEITPPARRPARVTPPVPRPVRGVTPPVPRPRRFPALAPRRKPGQKGLTPGLPETLKGLSVGIPSGALGLPADLLALIFRDAPQIASKLVTGKPLEVEERTFIDRLVGGIQRRAGSERIREGIISLFDVDTGDTPEEQDAFEQATLAGELVAPVPTAAGLARLAGKTLPPRTTAADVDELVMAIRADRGGRVFNPEATGLFQNTIFDDTQLPSIASQRLNVPLGSEIQDGVEYATATMPDGTETIASFPGGRGQAEVINRVLLARRSEARLAAAQARMQDLIDQGDQQDEALAALVADAADAAGTPQTLEDFINLNPTNPGQVSFSIEPGQLPQYTPNVINNLDLGDGPFTYANYTNNRIDTMFSPIPDEGFAENRRIVQDFTINTFDADMRDPVSGEIIPRGTRIIFPEDGIRFGELDDNFLLDVNEYFEPAGRAGVTADATTIGGNTRLMANPFPQGSPAAGPPREIDMIVDGTPVYRDPPASETVVEGTATEVDVPSIPDMSELIDPELVQPVAALPTEIARQPVITRDVARQGEVADYSPFFQVINALDASVPKSKEDILQQLGRGIEESVGRDRKGSGFMEFLEKHGADNMTKGDVVSLYTDYAPQMRVKTLTNSQYDADRNAGGPYSSYTPTGFGMDQQLTDYGQQSVGRNYEIPIAGTQRRERVHIYLSNPNTTVPLPGSQSVQLRGGSSISDHSLSARGGPGTSNPNREGGVPGYFAHIRLSVIEDDQGRRMSVIQEIQSNTAVASEVENKILKNQAELEKVKTKLRDPELSGEQSQTLRRKKQDLERRIAGLQDRASELKFYTPDERRNVEELQEIGPEIFETAGRSRVQSIQGTDEGDALGEIGQNYDVALQDMGDARATVGGNDIPTREGTLEILRSVYDMDPNLQEIPGREAFAGVLLDVLPEQIADEFAKIAATQTTEEVSRYAREQVRDSFLLGANVEENSVLASNLLADILRRPGALDEAQQASFDTLINNRIAQLEAVNFDPNFIAGQRGLGRYEYISDMDPFNPNQRRVDLGAADDYRVMKEDMERQGISSPYEYFTSGDSNRTNLQRLINGDPAAFSFVTGRPRPLGQDADVFVSMPDTATDISVMLNRAMRNNITKNYIQAAESRIPRTVDEIDSIREMNEKINELPISTERKRELGESFRTWITTINNPESQFAYKPLTPFEDKNATRDFAQYSPRLILQEMEKAGFDGVIFPDFEDMRDVGSRESVPLKEIYGDNVTRGLKQAGLTANDIELLPTIRAKNFDTGEVEDMIHKQTGNPHRPAQAVYFDKNRVKTKRYPREHPQAGETYEENLGPIRDIFAGRLIRRAKGGEVDLRPRKLIHSGIGAMARQVM